MAIKSNLKSLEPRKVQFQTRIKLLSNGFSYPSAFPNGEITVYPWDASVDDWIAERGRRGNQGTILYDLCAKVCDLNGCPIDQFVVGDINTVLLVSRAMRYNSRVEYECECPYCSHRTVEVIKVPDELGRVGEKAEGYPGYDEVTLQDSKDVVRFRPLLVRDEKLIEARDDVSRQVISDRLMHIITPIVAVNEGVPDSLEEAVRWYNALSPYDSTQLETAENEAYPHLDTELAHRCDRCHKRFKFPLDISADFFRSGLKSGKSNALASEAGPGMVGQEPSNQSEGRS